MDPRQHSLQQWLTEDCRLPTYQLEAIPADASFRRYFRVYHPAGTYIAMDAPPEREKSFPFVAIAKALRAQGLSVPEIFASDLAQGFLLLTDLGDKLYLKELNAHNVENFYSRALQALAILQACRKVDGFTISSFSQHFMRQELQLFQEWFLERYLNLNLDDETKNHLGICFDFLCLSAATQPQVFMHRDYHSANLLSLPNNQVGILDFQDAFMGPVTYDLVSLLRDCYIHWPDTLVAKLALQYRDQIQLAVSDEIFLRWFDLMGLQRHMKALLTFSRKFLRDQNSNYLQHIPRTLNYIAAISARYEECKMLNEFISERVLKTCVQ